MGGTHIRRSKLESLINYIVNKYQIHLALIGNKNKSKGIGVVSGKLLRLLKCNILSIPEDAKPVISNIWAGTDFSNASKRVLNVAQHLQRLTSAQVKSLHVYSIPMQFSPYIPKNHLDRKIENHLNEKYKKFIKKVDYKGELTNLITKAKEGGVAETFRALAERSGADLIIVGAKGGNTFSSLIIGSVTEELFNQDLQVPLWVVK